MSLFDITRHSDNTFTASELWPPFPSYPAFGGHLVSLFLLSAMLFRNTKPTSVHTYFLSPGEVGVPMNFEVTMLKEGQTSKFVNVKGYQSKRLVVTSDCLMCNTADGAVIYQDDIEVYDDVYVHLSTHFTNLWRIGKTSNHLNNVATNDTLPKNSNKTQYDTLHSNVDDIIKKIEENYKKLDKYFSIYIGRPNGVKRQFKIVLKTKNINFSVLVAFITDLFLSNSSLAWIRNKYTMKTYSNSDLKIVRIQNEHEWNHMDTVINMDSIQRMSLDHKIHFHCNKFHDELIFVTKCQFIGEKKVLFEGKLLSREGVLVASVTQEGIIAIRK
ncbi:Acyl-CoA thioesterase [Trachipleistophora hominis]|uniref:Acyl-CoA thioesterase n=1 Tax=Trachipleistophora hominis TaxID=72359 RepID=L7JUV9_TRAHO|nr:Acyl-CoA thioesterase [Trachipleistophora hominis]